MREIKFKAKRIGNGEWVYGYYGVKGKDTDLESHYIMESTLSNGSVDSFYFTDIEVIPETVSQFTGLKDKNGVDIYEGDKLEFLNGGVFKDFADKNTCVEYDDGSFCVTVIYDLHLIPINQEDCNFSLVLGNIHD